MNHVYTGIHMGIAHRAMQEALDDDGHVLKHGDAAIFINKNWTAAKIMTNRRAFIYVRETRAFTVSELLSFPRLVGGARLVLTQKQHDALESIRTKATGEKSPRKIPRAAA